MLFEDVHLEDDNVRLWKPTTRAWPGVPLPEGVREIRCVRGRLQVPGRQSFWHEQCGPCGQVFYAGPRPPSEQENKADVVRWLLPTSMCKILQHSGSSATISGVDLQGEPRSDGPVWVVGTAKGETSFYMSMEIFAASSVMDALHNHGARVPPDKQQFHVSQGWQVQQAQHRRRCREALSKHGLRFLPCS